jgi:hypothetical protein
MVRGPPAPPRPIDETAEVPPVSSSHPPQKGAYTSPGGEAGLTELPGFGAKRAQDQVCEPGSHPVRVSGQAQHREVEIIPHALSPEIASAEVVLQLELERQVAAINATQDVIDGQAQNVSALLAPDVDADRLSKAIDGPRERLQAAEI